MNKFKVLFIDEEQDSLDDFLDHVEASHVGGDIYPLTELPLGSLDLMTEKIISLNPDAIIVDFKLNEIKKDITYNVPYTGVDLLEAFLSIREGFPIFILTAFDDQAINNTEDVNKVYVKNILHNDMESLPKAKATFLDRVIASINHYRFKVRKANEDLVELLKKRSAGKASYEDEMKIIKLDSFLEKSIDAKCSIPDEYKASSNTKRLVDLLNKVDELINKITIDSSEV